MQLSSGTILQNGKYTITRTLGQGGFGITYEAEQALLGRKVAVKEFFMKDICNREGDSCSVSVPSEGSKGLAEKFKNKFIREAVMIAGMDNRHIVRIYDVFEENGTAYYVMEDLLGGSLSDKVRTGGPLSEDAAWHYVKQVAEALDYIHSMNIVHLDVKPSNILLNSNDEPVLIDFGISKHYDNSGEQTSSTPVGISKGYAPIERNRDGDVSQFKPSTDIYALGATCYYLVTGTNPPEASIVYEDGIDKPDHVSERFWKVIEKSMNPRRKERPQSVADFLSLYDPSGNHSVNILPTPLIVEDESTVIPPVRQEKTYFGHEAIDLGLSVKWASCNIGAENPYENGDYFAFGEVEPKSRYTENNYKYIDSHFFTTNLTKYNTSTLLNGFSDKKTKLDMEDDVARVTWGGDWRMPTVDEFRELIKECDWSYTSLNGCYGFGITSKINGNSIFLPAAGNRSSSFVASKKEGCYASSYLNARFPFYCYALNFHSSGSFIAQYHRSIGLTVRPVIKA